MWNLLSIPDFRQQDKNLATFLLRFRPLTGDKRNFKIITVWGLILQLPHCTHAARPKAKDATIPDSYSLCSLRCG